MERVKLSKNEKAVFRMIASGQDFCPATFPLDVFNYCVRPLESFGFAKGYYIEGGGVEAVKLTPLGRQYLAEHPRLCNPIDWKWVVTTLIAVGVLLVGIATLLTACKLIGD